MHSLECALRAVAGDDSLHNNVRDAARQIELHSYLWVTLAISTNLRKWRKWFAVAFHTEGLRWKPPFVVEVGYHRPQEDLERELEQYMKS